MLPSVRIAPPYRHAYLQVNESSQTATSQLMGEIVATRVSIGDISVTTSVVDEFIRILRS